MSDEKKTKRSEAVGLVTDGETFKVVLVTYAAGKCDEKVLGTYDVKAQAVLRLRNEMVTRFMVG